MTLYASPQPFDAPSSAQQRLAVAQLLVDAYAAVYPEDPPLLLEEEAAGLLHTTPGERIERWVIWEGGQALCYGVLDYSLTQNMHLANMHVLTSTTRRQQGLGRLMTQAVLARARELGRSTLTATTTSVVPGGEALALSLGAGVAQLNRRSQLDLQALSPTLIAAWTQRPPSEPYTLHTWNKIPEGYLERAANLMMVMNTAPRGELDIQDWMITPDMVRAWEQHSEQSGERCWWLAAEDTRSGELVGYSETSWHPQRPSLVFQGATAVRPSARGQGLGKWLKAAMLRHVMQHSPGARWIRTSNAEENAAMLGINVALGFQPWTQITQWQLKLER